MSRCLFAANVVRLQLCETGFPTKSGSSARAARHENHSADERDDGF
jgi:hypothetical protein